MDKKAADMRKVPGNIWMSGKGNPPTGAVTLEAFGEVVERIAPLHLAEAWDNVGLLSGHRSSLVKKVLVAIDLTPAVHDEAIRTGADLLLVYHPPIFKPMKHLRINGDEAPALAAALASYGVWIYSPHTALDTVDGGTNDVLAARVGGRVTGSFSHYAAVGEYLKFVTFIPEGEVERVADAVFAAGAGRIGTKAKYEKCSFRVRGFGTFQGDKETNPAVGQAGHYERAPEIRFETILPKERAGDVIAALRREHPYEEPAFDMLKMETPPEAVGMGRYAKLAEAERLEDFAARCKKELGLGGVQVIGDARRKVRRLAVMAGSAGRVALEQAREPYDCLVTGELKHHEMLAYAAAGVGVVCLGHSESERPVLEVVAEKVRKALPGVKVSVSRADRGPAKWV